MKKVTLCLLIFSASILTACSTLPSQDGAPSGHVDFSKIPDAVPRELPKSKYGNASSYTVLGKTYHVQSSAAGFDQTGIASWYGTKFNGQYTSTRNRYNLYAMTAAMKTLPIPTFVEVTNLQNNRHVIVEVDDRGPFDANRLIDLSYAAAGKLGVLQKGTALVEVRAINPATWNGNANEQLQSTTSHLAHPGSPELYIQVGAYDDKSNASHVLDQLRHSILQPSRIETGGAEGRPLYRVQIGPLNSVATSDLVSRRLRQIGYENSMAIVE